MWPGLELICIVVGFREGFCALEMRVAKCFVFPSSGPLSLLYFSCSTEVRGASFSLDD